MFTTALLAYAIPILVEHSVQIAMPFVTLSALWIAARIQKATGVNISKQLSELFNDVLARAAEAVVIGTSHNPVTDVIRSIKVTNPDLVKRLKLDKPENVAVFSEVAARAIKAARAKQLQKSR